jgi:hypothetical protein
MRGALGILIYLILAVVSSLIRQVRGTETAEGEESPWGKHRLLTTRRIWFKRRLPSRFGSPCAVMFRSRSSLQRLTMRSRLRGQGLLPRPWTNQ